MDLDYFRQVAPVTDDILDIIIAVGWALLLGNLVFQAVKSMATGLGFEGEDPKLLFTRTFVFAFLLLASPQICEIGLGISAHVIQLLQIPTSVTVTIPDENNFSLGASWLLIIIIGFIIMWQFVKLCFEVAERYVVTAILVLMAPLAFGMGGSKNTEDIFKGWCRMFGSMCVMMALNVVFLKLLISAMGYVPSGVAVLPWMLFIVGIARVARKADSIVARMGLNPAITGDGLGRGLPGMVAYAVVKGIGNSIAKAAGASVKYAKSGAGGNSSGPRANPRGPASPPPPPPSGGSGGSSASAGMGAQKGQQAGARSTVTDGTFVSQQQGQETVHDTGAPSPEGDRMEGAGRQSGQQGSGKAPTIHTHGTRRSSVPPEAKAGTRTVRAHTGSYTSAVGSDDKRSVGTLGRSGQSDAHGGSPRPGVSPAHDQGTVKKADAPGTVSAGSSRISSVTPGRRADAKAGTATHTSSRETMRERQPIQQDRTPKIPTPQGVAGADKSDSRTSSAAAAHLAAEPLAQGVGGSTHINSVPTRPPVGGRQYRDSTSVSGMAGTQPPAGGGGSSGGDVFPAGTAGKNIHAASGTVSGGADFSAGMAGTKTPPRKSRLSSGTAGATPPPRQETPLAGRGTFPAGTAGTRRPSNIEQTAAERRTPMSATAGTVPPKATKTPEVNRGTRRLNQGGTMSPALGGQTPPSKNRRRRRKT